MYCEGITTRKHLRELIGIIAICISTGIKEINVINGYNKSSRLQSCQSCPIHYLIAYIPFLFCLETGRIKRQFQF